MSHYRLLLLCFGLVAQSFYLSAAENSQNLETYLQELTKSAAIPGLNFGYMTKGQDPQLVSIGLADSNQKKTVTNETIFQAASLSKPVLAYIVLKLVEREEFSLDRPLVELLENPRFVKKSWAKLLTAKHVLSHQTGLPNWSNGDLEFKFEPGSDFGYSGEGYVYLQQVIEKVTGLSLQTLAEREVFKPLAMHDSYFTWSSDTPLKLAQGHDRAGNQVSRDIPKANAASSLHTTASDYLKFIKAWFDVNTIKLKVRQQAFSAIASKIRGGSIANKKIKMGWGLGWGVYEQAESKLVWHWGDNGVFRAFVAVHPATKSAFVYFTNSENGLAISKQITERIFPGNLAVSDWLGYGQTDSPLWQAERQGYEFESKGLFAKAQQSFKKVAEAFPDNQRLKIKINWLEPLVNPPQKPLIITPEYLNKIVGDYGERKLFLENGNLKYQRKQGMAYTLTPFYDSVFKVGKATGFRLKIVFNENGNAEKLVGLYDSGYSDESLRNIKSQ